MTGRLKEIIGEQFPDKVVVKESMSARGDMATVILRDPVSPVYYIYDYSYAEERMLNFTTLVALDKEAIR